MGTGVLVVDGKGRLVAANPAAERLLPSASAVASGTPLEAAAAAVQGLEPLVARCLATGRGASREVLDVRRGAESVGHLGVAVSPASGYGGEVAGALVLMTDLTEIRRVQQQVRLRDSLSAVGQVAAGIAHEVRNALGTILGYARLLEKRPEAQVRGPAKEILKEVQAVRAALDDFLAYARPPEPRPEPVPLGEVVRGCAAAAPTNLRVEVEGEFATVVADETLLRRAFGNLIQNASDAATSAGRTLVVRIAGSRVGETSLLVDVEDDGPGIPETVGDSVFLPFVTGRPSGTGLGLALVQRTMLDLGGSVEARRGRSGGALFRLRFPLAPAERHVS
jgi:signal transduction histidine kinase